MSRPVNRIKLPSKFKIDLKQYGNATKTGMVEREREFQHMRFGYLVDCLVLDEVL